MERNQQETPNFIVLATYSQPDRPSSAVTPYAVSTLDSLAQSTELGLGTLGALERYSMERLADLMTRKGGMNPGQKMRILLLMSACAAELRAVSDQLNRQMLEILQR